MTWSLHFDGNAAETNDLDNQFDSAQEQAKRNGLPELEIVDIGDVLNLVRAASVKYGRVTGDASGHWINFGPNDHRNRFGAMSVSIRKAEDPQNEKEKTT